jgi:hypothetical protein
MLFHAIFVLMACVGNSREPSVNHRSPSTSPSGKYVVEMPIGPKDQKFRYWRPTIRDQAGDVLYEETEDLFAGWLQIYWIWDEADRLWVYNSDNGNKYWWEVNDNGAQRFSWYQGEIDRAKVESYLCSGTPPEKSPKPLPPAELFPDYVGKTLKSSQSSCPRFQ